MSCIACKAQILYHNMAATFLNCCVKTYSSKNAGKWKSLLYNHKKYCLHLSYDDERLKWSGDLDLLRISSMMLSHESSVKLSYRNNKGEFRCQQIRVFVDICGFSQSQYVQRQIHKKFIVVVRVT